VRSPPWRVCTGYPGSIRAADCLIDVLVNNTRPATVNEFFLNRSLETIGLEKMDRAFLGIVGGTYLALAAWCSLSPSRTSKSVGFDLIPGAGQSEFLTVYGGLEVALGLVFLWGAYQPLETKHALFLCLIVHACLVVFRTAGFLLFSGIQTMTHSLAATEWVIFLGSAFLCWRKT